MREQSIALEYGIVYKVCEPEKLEKMTDRVITRLKRGSVNSYKAIKISKW